MVVHDVALYPLPGCHSEGAIWGGIPDTGGTGVCPEGVILDPYSGVYPSQRGYLGVSDLTPFWQVWPDMTPGMGYNRGFRHP